MAIIINYIEHNRKGGYYLCFTKATDQEKAMAKFIEKYGKEPEEVFMYKELLWLGPVNIAVPDSFPPREDKEQDV